jgi:hypothetical protein
VLPATYAFKIYVGKALEKWKRKCNPMSAPMAEELFLYTLHFANDQVVIAQDKKDEYLCRKLKEEYQNWGWP